MSGFSVAIDEEDEEEIAISKADTKEVSAGEDEERAMRIEQ